MTFTPAPKPEPRKKKRTGFNSTLTQRSKRMVAKENALVQAKRQEIVATRGNLRAHANDDVLIDGERIRMNC